jgi:hypothetical protein
MLAELAHVRQIKGEHRRRWFCDRYFDLIVWIAEDGGIAGFQLCYDKDGKQRALTWKPPGRYTHTGIDDGENRPGRFKQTPILVADGSFDHAGIAARFKRASLEIDPPIAEFVYAKLTGYASQ